MNRTLTLKRGKERVIANRHPWIFAGAIQTERGPEDAPVGDLVDELLHRAPRALVVLEGDGAHVLEVGEVPLAAEQHLGVLDDRARGRDESVPAVGADADHRLAARHQQYNDRQQRSFGQQGGSGGDGSGQRQLCLDSRHPSMEERTRLPRSQIRRLQINSRHSLGKQAHYLAADRIRVHLQVREHARRNTLDLVRQAEQDVLGAYVVVFELQRLAQ